VQQEGKEKHIDISTETEIAATAKTNPDAELEEANVPDSVSVILPGVAIEPAPTKSSLDEVHSQVDLPDVPFRFSEKRHLNWSNKTCMWPRSDTSARDKITYTT